VAGVVVVTAAVGEGEGVDVGVDVGVDAGVVTRRLGGGQQAMVSQPASGSCVGALELVESRCAGRRRCQDWVWGSEGSGRHDRHGEPAATSLSPMARSLSLSLFTVHTHTHAHTPTHNHTQPHHAVLPLRLLFAIMAHGQPSPAQPSPVQSSQVQSHPRQPVAHGPTSRRPPVNGTPSCLAWLCPGRIEMAFWHRLSILEVPPSM